MRGNILYRLINFGVLQSAQFYLFRWLFWRTSSTLKIAKLSPPLMTSQRQFMKDILSNLDIAKLIKLYAFWATLI